MNTVNLALAVLLITTSPVMGQKKITPADSSGLTGIRLPAGSQQDKRGISTVSARMLFETESKKAGVGVRDPEVFILPPASRNPYNADSLVTGLEAQGWAVQPLESDDKFAWLVKNGRYLMAYFQVGPKQNDLYFAEASSTPMIAAGTAGRIEPGPVQPMPGQPVDQAPGQPAGSGNNSPGAVPGDYVYRTTRFDDGWTASIEADKVVVTKGELRVFIYFAIPYSPDARGAGGRDWVWQQFIGREFTIRQSLYRDNGQVMEAMQPPYVEGEAVDRATGRACYLALYVTTVSGQMFPTLAIAPDAQTLRNAFPKAEDKYHSDLDAMRNANRFAVDARDLAGTWVGGDGAAVNYYDAYTGSYLGMSTSSFSYEFHFDGAASYKSMHKGAGGQVGNMRVYQQEFKGAVAVNTWKMVLTNRWDGKTETFNCHFEAVRGGRVLHLQKEDAPGIKYLLVRASSNP